MLNPRSGILNLEFGILNCRNAAHFESPRSRLRQQLGEFHHEGL
jgi:hypothetical protein